MFELASRLIEDESGASAIEYGIIASLVSVAAASALANMGTSLEGMFTNVSTTFSDAVSP